MRRLFVIAAVAAWAGPAAGNEQSPRDVMIAAFEDNKCVLTLQQINGVFRSAGIDNEEVPPTARQLAADGMVGMINDRTAYLKSGAVCESFEPPAIPVDPAVSAHVIQTFEANDCRIDFDDRPFEKFQDDHDSRLIETAVARLMNDGLLTFDGPVAVLKTGDRCGT